MEINTDVLMIGGILLSGVFLVGYKVKKKQEMKKPDYVKEI